ncbi:MAG TPA: hypothetical protein VN790_10340 [Steroidobacteraceae bacterium]|nr:hypothetical protein [Steroidobacteraceae bacterium]
MTLAACSAPTSAAAISVDAPIETLDEPQRRRWRAPFVTHGEVPALAIAA